MLKGRKIFLICAAVLLLMQPLLYAESDDQKTGDFKDFRERRFNKHHGGLFGNPARMQEKLGLSDAQVKTIADINKEYAKKILNYREKLAPKHIQLKRLFLEDTIDLDKVRSLIKEISDLRVELHVLRIQQWLEIEKTLTTDQKAKLRLYRMHYMDKGRRERPEPGPHM